MTEHDHEMVDEIELAGNPMSDEDKFDAECQECGIAARFNSPGSSEIGDRFRHHCYSCNSGRRPDIGPTSVFEVTDDNPDCTSLPVTPTAPPVYSADDEP